MSAAPEAAPAALSIAEPRGSACDRLKPGPGKSASAVAESQRGRFLTALTILAAERGYDKVTIRDLVAVAKVSSRAFYLHFGGKEDCLLATHERLVRRAAKRIVASQASERDWLERLRLAFHAAVREVEREPAAARLVLVEACGAGPAAREQVRRADLSFAAMLSDSFERAPDGLGAPPLAAEGIVAGATTVLRHALASGELLSSQTADELLEWALAVRRCAAEDPLADQPFRIPSSKPAMRSRSGITDRDLILAAVEKLVAADELEHLTVKRIRSAAGMTRQRFNVHFAGVEDCIAAAARQRVEVALSCARQTQTAGAEQRIRTEEAILAFCGAFARDRALTKLCVADARVSEQINSGIGAILLADSVSERQPMPRFTEATAAMIWGVIRNRLRDGSRGSLCRTSPTLAAVAGLINALPSKSGTSNGGVGGEAPTS